MEAGQQGQRRRLVDTPDTRPQDHLNATIYNQHTDIRTKHTVTSPVLSPLSRPEMGAQEVVPANRNR